MGPPDSHGVPRAPRYSGCRSASPSFAYRTVTVYGFTFQRILLGRDLAAEAVLQPRGNRNPLGLGSSPVARHYWGNHVCFLFLRVLRCFSSPGWPPNSGIAGLQPAGLPHSDIRGSRVACTSPRLFAACHVFRRLLEPRHPPYALAYFRLCRGTKSAACIYLGFSLFAIALRHDRHALQPTWRHCSRYCV